MVFGDYIESKILKGIEKIEEKADDFFRKGDALLGCEEYENATTKEIIEGVMGKDSKP